MQLNSESKSKAIKSKKQSLPSLTNGLIITLILFNILFLCRISHPTQVSLSSRNPDFLKKLLKFKINSNIINNTIKQEMRAKQSFLSHAKKMH